MSLVLDLDQQEALTQLGIELPEPVKLPGRGGAFFAFDIPEDHPRWDEWSSVLKDWQAADIERTEFSSEDISSATWAVLRAEPQGYPQPRENKFGYREATYDLTDWCRSCGVGKKQKAPFQMKGEPQWGTRELLQMFWVDDEIFVKPELWQTVFAPRAIGFRQVTDTSGKILEHVVQLDIPNTVPVSTASLTPVPCAVCGRTKYLPVKRGPYPELLGAQKVSALRTQQAFGSGAQAGTRIVVSRNIVTDLTNRGAVGSYFIPCAESG